MYRDGCLNTDIGSLGRAIGGADGGGDWADCGSVSVSWATNAVMSKRRAEKRSAFRLRAAERRNALRSFRPTLAGLPTFINNRCAYVTADCIEP